MSVVELINFPRIREISREYFANDASVQAFIEYLYTDEFQAAWTVFKSAPEVEDIYSWMLSHGVNLDNEVTAFSSELSQITFAHLRLQGRVLQNFSLKTFQDELKAQIKFDELNALIDSLLESGNDFAHLYLILKVSRPALEKLFLEEQIQVAVSRLESLGVDVENLKLKVYEVLRWS